MRLYRRTAPSLRKTLPPALLLLALLSAGNVFVYTSGPESVSKFEAVADFGSSTQSSKTQDIRLDVNVAVVIPFHRCQARSQLHKTFEFWHQNPPCMNGPAPNVHLSLVFYYSEDLDVEPSIKRKVRALMWGLPKHTRRCFDDVHFLSARLSPMENIYPFGPCHQFYNAFLLLRNMRFSHWLLYEPDVVPIQAGWGDALLNLSSQNVNCTSWWQLGSWPMYKNKVDKLIVNNVSGKDLHLNGNAVYCLLSPEFDDYRYRVQITYPPNGCAGPKEFTELGGYDHALYRYRLLPENHLADKFYLFVNDEFIMNFGESSYDVSDVLRKHPSTMLVHGKYPFLEADMKLHLDQKYATHNLTTALENIYISQFNRKPSRSELHFFTRAFQHIHGQESTIRCVLREITSYCDRRNHNLLLSSCGGQVHRVFELHSKAVLTGLFIRLGQRMPGPEAKTYVKYAGAQSCSSVTEKLCRLTLFSCPEKEFLHLASKQTSLYPLYDELAYFIRAGIVTALERVKRSLLLARVAMSSIRYRAERNCYSIGKTFSTAPLNYVMESSYLGVCKNASYDAMADVLSCTWKNNTLTMPRPYECADDINVNQLSMMLDC